MKIIIKDPIGVLLGFLNVGTGTAALCRDMPFIGGMCLVVGFWSLIISLEVRKS